MPLIFCEVIDNYVPLASWITPTLSSARPNWESHWTGDRLGSRHFVPQQPQMSTMKISMLLSMHAIFWGLQDHLKDILRSLPGWYLPSPSQWCHCCPLISWVSTTTSMMSPPLYTWAARMCSFLFSICLLINCLLVLDPRNLITKECGMIILVITYWPTTWRMPSATSTTIITLTMLIEYHQHLYWTALTPTTAILFKPQGSPQKLDFTSRYRKEKLQ